MTTNDSPRGNSRAVSSSQEGVHPRLFETLEKHSKRKFAPRISAHNQAAFEAIQVLYSNSGKPLILDSFCGTGMSSRLLAARLPDHLVVGIDKSAHRLNKQAEAIPENCLLLRAECEPVWHLLAQHKVSVAKHFLLYPNPWPKPAHLMRRLHGHPAFFTLLELGGQLELRSNWLIYMQEFAAAMQWAGHSGRLNELSRCGDSLSLFERKYRASRHELWQYCCDVSK